MHAIDPLTIIHSTQCTVYAIQSETHLAPYTQHQNIPRLAKQKLTCGSPVLVDIASQVLLSRFKSAESVNLSAFAEKK